MIATTAAWDVSRKERPLGGGAAQGLLLNVGWERSFCQTISSSYITIALVIFQSLVTNIILVYVINAGVTYWEYRVSMARPWTQY